ncbi:heme ABC transporter ATP-binding protein [Pontiellaceae bacterium B12219]|nr:heme ABC transporter ATP-binding protein [Pontiellaceae bacterium B12219]
MIEAIDLEFSVRTELILKPTNLTLQGAGITAILGPNGAAKSTLLKCLSGANKPTGGTVRFDQKELSAYSAKALAQRRAVLSQSTEISFPFKVHEVVIMGRNPHLIGRESEADHRIVEQALQCVDALNLMNREFSTLSGGEKQRVQLARVFAQVWEQSESLVLLDEPTSALDLRHQSQILGYVQQQVERFQMTVLCILHDINLAAMYADRIILMKNGAIQYQGSKERVLTAERLEDVFETKIMHHRRENQSRFFLG